MPWMVDWEGSARKAWTRRALHRLLIGSTPALISAVDHRGHGHEPEKGCRVVCRRSGAGPREQHGRLRAARGGAAGRQRPSGGRRGEGVSRVATGLAPQRRGARRCQLLARHAPPAPRARLVPEEGGGTLKPSLQWEDIIDRPFSWGLARTWKNLGLPILIYCSHLALLICMVSLDMLVSSHLGVDTISFP